MVEPAHILISLEKKHAEAILTGTKHVELRRRSMAILPGTVVWIYVKKPLGSVVGSARVVDCHSFAPSTLWSKFSDVSGLTRQEFFGYFQGVAKGFAIALTETERLHKAVSLDTLRNVSGRFHPPQFFMRLSPEDKVLKILKRAGRTTTSAS